MKTKESVGYFFDFNFYNVLYFKMLMEKQDLSKNQVVIVLADVKDKIGIKLANVIIPGINWNQYAIEDDTVLGLVSRVKIERIINIFSPQLLIKFNNTLGVPVVTSCQKQLEVFSL